MWTNGCTYGEAHHCGKHGTPENVAAHNRKGPVMAKSAAYTSEGPRGVAMKRAGWKAEKSKVPTREALDAIAHRHVPAMFPKGYGIRKAR